MNNWEGRISYRSMFYFTSDHLRTLPGSRITVYRTELRGGSDKERDVDSEAELLCVYGGRWNIFFL